LREGARDYDDSRCAVPEAVEMFGPGRCMVASNFPVDGLRVSYRQMFDDFKRMTGALSPAERQRLFHDNAAAFYRL
jgi:predicted TIM-barrel fold metal-dependent hydrolase